MTLRLTRAQRKALFAGEHPRIGWPKNREYSWPQVHQLSSKVSIEIVGCERVNEGDWNLHYVVKDDRPRLLRARTRSAAVEQEDHLEGRDLRKASEESAYTSNPGASLRGTGEEVSREEQERFAKESGDPLLLLLREHKREIRGALDRVRDNPLLRGTGVSSSELRFAERKIEGVLSKIEARISGSATREAT